jgi:hypothetical protein
VSSSRLFFSERWYTRISGRYENLLVRKREIESHYSNENCLQISAEWLPRSPTWLQYQAHRTSATEEPSTPEGFWALCGEIGCAQRRRCDTEPIIARGSTMIKKIALIGAGLIFLASPLLVSAQTTSVSSNASLIATLMALVQQLEQELQQLIAARSSTQQTTIASFSSPQPAASGMTTDVALVCNASVGLKRGDTDMSTGGKVSQLQKMLGINPATGYYGAQTAIGFNNICNGGNAQPSSVAGMSKYTDVNFGFSFWYPSSWTVSDNSSSLAGDDQPLAGFGIANQVTKLLLVSNGVKNISIAEITSASGVRDACGKCSDDVYFDSNKGEWMDNTPGWTISQGLTNANLHPADLSQATMGGLHIFWDSIVPLSADNFVVVASYGGINSSIEPLTKTILATNPNVATPVSTAQQTTTIQAEANAYGVSTANTSGLSASPTSGPAPLTVTFVAPPSAGGDYVYFGDGADGCSVPGVTNDGMTGCSVPSGVSFTHTYTQPGVYTMSVSRLLPSTTLGTATITVTGSSALSAQTYTNSQYGFSVQYPASAQITACQHVGDWMPPRICQGNPLVVFDNAIGVFASSDAQAVAYCNAGQLGVQATIKTINTIPFAVSRESDLAAGTEHENVSYSKLKAGVCYSITADMSGATIGFDDTKVIKELESIVGSFRFTQ